MNELNEGLQSKQKSHAIMADCVSYEERHIINCDWYQEPCGVMVLSALNSLTLFEESKPLHLPKFYTFVWFVWLCPTASVITFKNLEFRCLCSLCEGWQKRSWERSLNPLSSLNYCRIFCFGEFKNCLAQCHSQKYIYSLNLL